MSNAIEDTIREITEDVYSSLGSGHSESVYDCATQVGLRLKGLSYESQKVVELKYRDHHVGEGYPDLLVRSGTDALVVELKAVGGDLGAPEEQQLRNYMRILDVAEGLLVNFQQPGRAGKETRVAFRRTELQS
jgi:GxxExxY protein